MIIGAEGRGRMDFVSSVVQETLKMEKTVYCLQECTDDSTLLKPIG
jgi:hypothetical protein